MRTDQDLIGRLAAADPAPRTFDDEREAEVLLARLLATPVDERRAPRRRRLLATGAATVAIAATAFAAIGIVSSDESEVVEQAVAAVTRDDAVYHVRELRRLTGNIPGGARGGPFLNESWRSSDGRLHEKVFTADGSRLLEEVAGWRHLDRGSGPVLIYDPRADRVTYGGIGRPPDADRNAQIDPEGDPGQQLAALEARGLLRAAGMAQVGDRRGYRLVSDPIRVGGAEQRFEYVVDTETYLPLEKRELYRRRGEVFGSVSEFLVYERLPLDTRSRMQLDLDPHPGASCADGVGDVRGLGFVNPCS